MTFVNSRYVNKVPSDEFTILPLLSFTSMALTMMYVKHHGDIRKRFNVSSAWCHLAARVVAHVFADFELTVVDGRLYDMLFKDEHFELMHTKHSWCRTKHGSILDVAPVGMITFAPLLLAHTEKVSCTEWGYITDKYKPSEEVRKEVESIVVSPAYTENFPVYVELLTLARHRAKKMWKQQLQELSESPLL